MSKRFASMDSTDHKSSYKFSVHDGVQSYCLKCNSYDLENKSSDLIVNEMNLDCVRK